MRQSAASLRRDAHPALEWRAWGEQPAAFEPVLPPHPAWETSAKSTDQPQTKQIQPFHTAKQYSFNRLCGGRNHLKRRSFLPPPPPTSLAVRRNSFQSCPKRRGENSLRVSPRPAFRISANPGRGAGEPPRAQLPKPWQATGGVWGGVIGAGAPPSPMRQSAALLRRDAHPATE